MESLLIYGGSFDPIHNGHLRMARAASLLLNADVVFVPSKSPRWKNPMASPSQRLSMLKLALTENGSGSFFISDFELKSDSEINYSVDTVAYFARKYRKRQLYLLIGADEANSFPKWKDPDLIAKMARIVYVPRPGVKVDDVALSRFRMIRLDYSKSGEVSSSDVRRLQSSDIPMSVRSYIEQHGLYYFQKLSRLLTPKRLLHSVSVGHLAYSIAIRNKNPSYQKAYCAGLLHDIGKYLPKEEARLIMRRDYPEFLDMPEWSYHQFTGVTKAKEVFGVDDDEILQAISRHATGDAHMPPLSKIIYSSDKIEPTRGYDSSKLINACYKNYYTGFLEVFKANMEFLAEGGYRIDNPLTKKCYELYLGD